MDRPAIEICEAFAHAGYPLDVEALLIIEVEGSRGGDRRPCSTASSTIAQAVQPEEPAGSAVGPRAAAIWKGRKAAFGAMGRIADYICMDGTIPTGQLPYVLRRIGEICDGYGLRVANVFHAGDGNLHPLILYDANDAGRAARRRKRPAPTSSSSASRSAAA